MFFVSVQCLKRAGRGVVGFAPHVFTHLCKKQMFGAGTYHSVFSFVMQALMLVCSQFAHPFIITVSVSLSLSISC